MEPSGGDKTTAINLTPRFWDVAPSAVRVGGVDVRQIDPHVLTDQTAFVSQNSCLFKVSILENVRVARLDATREQMCAVLAAAQCGDTLEKLPQGMGVLVGSEGIYLFGNEQQHITLAGVIPKDTSIVVLDEVIVFANPENETLIQGVFPELTRSRTAIMIVHRLSTAMSAGEIPVSEEGRTAEQGSHQELTAAGGLYVRIRVGYNQTAQ